MAASLPAQMQRAINWFTHHRLLNDILWRKTKWVFYNTNDCFVSCHCFWYVMEICYFSHVCFHHFVMFLMMCFIYIYIKCVHFRNKCFMIFVDMWKIQLIWISLSICITDDIHGIHCVVLYWGGDVWGHWFLKWQPKILNCQDSSHILKTYETFVYTLLLFLHLNYI